MLTLTRRQARCLRGVFRRHTLGITSRGAVPPLVLRTEDGQLRAQYRYDALADALAEASATACDDNTRYALNGILLKGNGGAVVATDGRQLLVQDGFDLPWTGDVLIRRSPVFASQALPRGRPLSVGKTDTHVVV